MSAVNHLHIEHVDPKDGIKRNCIVQFKFGDTWETNYRLGDKLAWGGNDNGEPGKRRVVVHGVTGSCDTSGVLPEDWFIFIENDVIKSVEPDDGRYNFDDSDGYYLVLEE
jgi:hypothetical protein